MSGRDEGSRGIFEPFLVSMVDTTGAHLTVSVRTLRHLLAYAGRVGVDVERVLRTMRMSSRELDDPDARIPWLASQRAWAEIVVASGDAAFGLHRAQHVEEGTHEVLSYAFRFSRTLRDALDQFVRLYRLVDDALASQILRDRRTTRLVHLVGGMHPHNQDSFLATVVGQLRRISSRPISPRQVFFEHAPHARHELAAFFQCPVHFSHARSELVFGSQDLELPTRDANPPLAALLDRYADDRLGRLPAVGSYVDHARQAVAHLIQTGPPTLEALARRMRASPRTVQRRLWEAGTTHTRLVDDVRRELASRYVASTRLSVTEIAFLLGYETDSSFRRAFKKWTGKSPSEARHLGRPHPCTIRPPHRLPG
jgi:AraC-like DNA-binding protein